LKDQSSCKVWPVRINVIFLFLFASLFVFAPVRGISSAESAAAGLAAEAAEEPERAGGFSPSLLASPSASAAPDAHWRKVSTRLEPYYGHIVDSIIVRGNSHTQRITIIREMTTREGERLEERLLQRDMSFLRGMGYFSDVDVSAERTSSGHCAITIYIAERPGLFMRFPYPVVNYDFEKGISYGVRWRVKNFRGLGEELRITALKRRDKEHGGDIGWRVPWLMGRRLQTSLNLFAYRRLEEPESDDFIKERNGASAYLGVPLTSSLLRQLWISTTISVEGRDSRLTCTRDGTTTNEMYRQNLLALGLELSFDSRDNRISPWAGFMSRFRAVRFTSIYGLEQEYIFYYTAQHLYVPVSSLGTIIFALQGDVREGDLPAFFEMGIGGASDLRGYPDNDRRGRAKILGSVQLRRPIYGPRVFNIPYIGKFDLALNGVAFVDTGTLTETVRDLDDSRFDVTGGIGIEVISPIQDIVRFEVAADGEGHAAIYFTSGTRF
jgi:outer membrane protein assembly factor BamA